MPIRPLTVPSHPHASLSRTEARALVLRAQGFGDRGLRAPVDVLHRLGAIQLDSVNVLARSHEIVPFSRLGPCSSDIMHRAIYRERQGFEYWGHAASWLPMADYRYFLPRMAAFRQRGGGWGPEAEHAQLLPRILERIRGEGPLGSAAFEDSGGQRGTWWDWKPAKEVLEILFARGELMVADRTSGFARLYDLPERVLPPGLDHSDPSPAEAHRYLLRRAIAALGLATGPEAADYCLAHPGWRPQETSWITALTELIEAGEIAAVAGATAPIYALPTALAGPLTLPTHRPVFLSPFDNLVWTRETLGDRVAWLFDFHFRIELDVPGPKRVAEPQRPDHQHLLRIELDVPGPKRVHGYSVLPLLAQGTLGGRADLKFNRKAGALLVRALYLEGATPDEAAAALVDLATHLGVRRIRVDRVEPAGALAAIRSQHPFFAEEG